MQIPNALSLSFLAAGLLPFTSSTPTNSKYLTSLPLASQKNSTITTPIAAAWMYLSDDLDYATIPQKWNRINFTTVDLLYIGPVGIQPNGLFGLYNGAHGPLAKRFHWTIQRARSQNPGVKIIASQFWGGTPQSWGDDLSALKGPASIERYASSVAAFMMQWEGLDGYDIDYEDRNIRPDIGYILEQVHRKLDAVPGLRKYYVTISPSETTYLKPAVPALNYVNMQNYAGGISLTPKDFLDLGLKPEQLLYGYDAERPEDGHSILEVEKDYTDGGLAGIHVWRLDSSDMDAEGERQRQIYQFLHHSGTATQ